MRTVRFTSVVQSTQRHVQALRQNRRLAVMIATLFTMLFLGTTPTSAQGTGGGTGGTAAFSAKIEAAATNLTTLGRPFALLAVVLCILSIIFEPALPGWARENKMMIRGVLIACIALGAAPDLVSFFIA